jgi:heptosyltransferase-2/heptosyltransferase-3
LSPCHLVRLFGLRLIGRLYPKPRRPATPPRSLLLIRPDHLGDLLFLTPALHALRAALPDARLTLLAGPWSADIVRGNPDLDAVLTCPFPGFERSIDVRELHSRTAPYHLLLDFARQLRPGGYDTAVVLRFDHWWGAWLAAAAGIPRRIGYDWPETRPFLTDARPYRPARHEVEQNGTLLATLAPAADWQLGPTRFAVTEADRAWAAAWLRNPAPAEEARSFDPTRPLVAIHPGAGAAVKQWPATAWAAVADSLADRYGAQIALTGSAGERTLTQAIADQMAHPALDAAGETTLGQLAALQAHCALVMGPDCGPLHLAVAVGAPTVHLYGPVSPAKFGPWGDPARHLALTTDWPCAPCEKLDWPVKALAQHRCVAAITPDSVLRAACCVIADQRPTTNDERPSSPGHQPKS